MARISRTGCGTRDHDVDGAGRARDDFLIRERLRQWKRVPVSASQFAEVRSHCFAPCFPAVRRASGHRMPVLSSLAGLGEHRTAPDGTQALTFDRSMSIRDRCLESQRDTRGISTPRVYGLFRIGLRVNEYLVAVPRKLHHQKTRKPTSRMSVCGSTSCEWSAYLLGNARVLRTVSAWASSVPVSVVGREQIECSAVSAREPGVASRSVTCPKTVSA